MRRSGPVTKPTRVPFPVVVVDVATLNLAGGRGRASQEACGEAGESVAFVHGASKCSRDYSAQPGTPSFSGHRPRFRSTGSRYPALAAAARAWAPPAGAS